jgi:hypothetical protein
VVTYLSETWGRELVMMARSNGVSSLYTACQNGHLEVVKYLSETWGRELVMMADSDVSLCCHAAHHHNYVEVAEYPSTSWSLDLPYSPSIAGTHVSGCVDI